MRPRLWSSVAATLIPTLRTPIRANERVADRSRGNGRTQPLTPAATCKREHRCEGGALERDFAEVAAGSRPLVHATPTIPLFMRDMAGSYGQSLKTTFIPEFLSMNFLMAGMVPLAALFAHYFAASRDPLQPNFWFRMSMALLAGFIVAYPMNWWLVARHLKHGMKTVRTAPWTTSSRESTMLAATLARSGHSGSVESQKVTSGMSARAVRPIALFGMGIFSLAAFAAGLALAMWIATVR